ncbi:antibiotic biosynthesis monooxygenase [Rudanella paleaurantiibacter]|uniref:Antibiotic biosynthesis monooxygenase n=1 Tax=Rudanella paleaurantiibacter TaxID=2614655 RepID=A0A7J5TS87_9BACT|nr:putative quinol monooxygenase [Rudanella paleaurantiibacter]KAB7725961.1 antibiotic biosynthesis monooxygenase [Rudanella paleaurantiibacter]
MSLLVFATITANPGQEEALKAAFHELIPLVRAEAACQLYELYHSTENPTRFIMHERWDDEAGLQAHSNMPHMKAFGEKARTHGWLAKPAELIRVPE